MPYNDDTEKDELDGNLTAAADRFRRFADIAVDRLPARELNFVVDMACFCMANNGYPQYLEQFNKERAAEKNGLAAADDFERFMHSIGAVDPAPCPRRKIRRVS
jgi:hypothetical protein